MTNLIVDHLWQSTLFVLAAWLLTLALKSNGAHIRYWAWFAASIKFLVPFSALTWIGSRFSWSGEAIPVFGGAAVSFQQALEPLTTPIIALRDAESTFDVAYWLVVAWMIGSVALSVRWIVAWTKVQSIARNAMAIEFSAPIVVKESAIHTEPGVLGIVRPVLMLPQGIAARLSSAQMQAVIAHELCHVRRRDNLTAAIHMFVEVLFWFHPLVWWIGARLVEERERACDEAVIELRNDPQAYAEGILKVCQFYMESKLACVAGVSGSDLKKRVEAIMSNRRSIELHMAKRTALSVLIAAIVVVPIVGGVMTPTYANGPQVSFERIYGIDNLRMEVFESRSVRPPRHVDDMELFQPGQTIRNSIAPAYQVQPKQIVDAPAWIDTVRYDKYIGGSGLAPEGFARVNQYALLERRLLAERFALKFHREMRLQTVYVLSIADRGRAENLREMAPLDTGQPVKQSIEPGASERAPRLMLAAPSHHFASMLSRELDSIVLDRTGLTGLYRFELPADTKTDVLPGVLESRLGLKLTRSTEQVEMFVVDSIEQPRTRVAEAAVAAVPARAATAARPAAPASAALPAIPAPAQIRKALVDQRLALNQTYGGERLNIQIKDQDLRDFAGMLEKITGRRIVVHPSISERVTFKTEDTPWEQILAELAVSKGLVMRRESDVIYIDPPR